MALSIKSLTIRLSLMLLCSSVIGTVNAQWYQKEIASNLRTPWWQPYPVQSVLTEKRIAAMHFCVMEEADFRAYLSDSTRAPVPAEENEAWKMTFDKKGMLVRRDLYVPGQSAYVYTYDAQGNCTVSLNYRLGQASWQCREDRKYDTGGHLLQVKTLWKDFYTGKDDQIDYASFTWKNNDSELAVLQKFTLSHWGASGKVSAGWFYKLDADGCDTLLVEKRLNEETGKWSEKVTRSVWKRDDKDRIVERLQITESDTLKEEWTYDEKGRLSAYTRSGRSYGADQFQQRDFIYNSSDLLIGVCEQGKTVSGYFGIVYDYFPR
jgi:hypothetical protein